MEEKKYFIILKDLRWIILKKYKKKYFLVKIKRRIDYLLDIK